MGRAQSTIRIVLVGATCLGVGFGLGSGWGPTASPVWTEPAPVRAASVLPSFADLVQEVGPAVVSVRARLVRRPEAAPLSGAARPAPLHEEATGYRTGSGFLVHADGLVVTCRHVILGARSVEVTLPRRGVFRADLVGDDPAADLALLRLVEAPGDLPVVALGRSEDLRAGDWIVAVGNPFGYAQSVTHGVVSFVGRNLLHSDYGVTNDCLQISAPGNPGSSGCPVLDLHGRVVGVMTQAPATAQGISFAVPSRTLKWSLDAMERQPDGRVRRGYLGIEFASRSGVDDVGAPRQGAVIVHVIEGEPAHQAGIRVGDVVLRVDGAPVPDARSLHDRIARGEPGTRLAMQLLRGGLLASPVVAVLGEASPAKSSDPAN